MKQVARFEKISEVQYIKDFSFEEDAKAVYALLRLPRRATSGSAGYDFFAPFAFTLEAGQSICIPTGMRVQIADGWMLQCYPRSGLGFRYRLQMDNTVGIIDSDYFFADNEGHIFLKLMNDSREGKQLRVNEGAAFAQGVFVEYGITFDDDAQALRTGGVGSTDK